MSHFISLERAIEMTTLFRKNRDSILVEGSRGQNILPISETFDRAAFDVLLAQPGCAGIRMYYGMDETLKVHIISVGVNASNQDLLAFEGAQVQTAADGNTEPGSTIVEAGVRCPTDCGEPSPLNP